ncbi:type I-E CRISPR-associated protein Cas7/Cse4/CasC [Streptomyces sp. NPDC097619]|uniref:type I-E CRISPR-associated protein Cas7/Cse4/CasC n=1 Tax=Streptomyces sp. NPDC097619 TaxID=3157228 RepID=UPI0033241B1C
MTTRNPRTILDIHVLQTVPPSNLNRDDTGSPKSAFFGGVRRARVSSQSWKRATRSAFGEILPAEELGVRTKKVAEALAERILLQDKSLAESTAVALAAEVLKAATGSAIEAPTRGRSKAGEADAASASPVSKYLMFLSVRQLDALAALALEGSGGGDLAVLKDHLKDKNTKARARQAVDTRHSVDIALFGRMVADSADLNVDAATQVAHALSVHRADIESDYFTAVDDRNREDESGAGMIGSIDFNSATLYRYASVDVDALQRNLGLGLREDEEPSTPAARAAAAFLQAFVTSLPTGKINTFGNHTLPSAVIVKVRDRWPVSFVGAFEKPVAKVSEGGFLQGACEELAEFVEDLEQQYGLTSGDPCWVVRVGEDTRALAPLGTRVPLATMLTQVQETLAARLGGRA